MPHHDSKVLVYHYRANNSPVVKNGITAVYESELHDILQSSKSPHAQHPLTFPRNSLANGEPDPNLQKTTKKLPRRGARHVDIYQRDLLPVSSSSEDHGTEESNVAGIKLPFWIWLEGLATGGYEEVVVLSEGFGGNGGRSGDGAEGKAKGKGKGVEGGEVKVDGDEKAQDKSMGRAKAKQGSLDVGEGG